MREHKEFQQKTIKSTIQDKSLTICLYLQTRFAFYYLHALTNSKEKLIKVYNI